MLISRSTSKRVVAGLLCIGAMTVPSAGHSHAQTASIAVEEVKLLKADDGTSKLTAKLTTTDLGGPASVAIILNDDADSDCVPDSQPILAAGVAKEVALKFPAGCDLTGDVRVEFVATALAADTTASNTVTVPVGDSPAEDPNFAPLGMYLLAFGFAAVIVVLSRHVNADSAWRKREGDDWRGRTLPGLTSTWKLGDSWASNVTVAAAVFTGIFGTSDVLKSILGEDHETQVAVAAVAAALTAGLVGAAPIVLSVLRREPKDAGATAPAGTILPMNYTTSGVVGASWLVLAANVGVVATVSVALLDSEPISVWWLLVTACGASALITVYVGRSLRRTLREGVIPPKPPAVESSPTADDQDEAPIESLEPSLRRAQSATSAMP